MPNSDLKKSCHYSRIGRRKFLQATSLGLAGPSFLPGYLGHVEANQFIPEHLKEVRAMTFDVFGTVVDWRTSIIDEGSRITAQLGLQVDWPSLADRWRGGYGPAMNQVRTGDLPWTKIDDLHRMILDRLIPEFGLDSLSSEEVDDLNRVWHRLKPWPDSIAGLTRLRTRYVLSTLSNGNVALLVNMAKNAGLPWDAVLSAELAEAYKPDPSVYLKAADLLGYRPNEVMMVAAHASDLRASAAVGFRTAFVPRPLEYGSNRSRNLESGREFDMVAKDFVDLAVQLGL